MAEIHGLQQGDRAHPIAHLASHRQPRGPAGENERLLRSIIDHSPVLMAYCSPDLSYKFVNKPYAERFGLLPEEVAGMTISELLGEKTFASIEPHLNAVLCGERVEFEMEIPNQQLGSPYMWVTYEPEFDEDRQVIGFFVTVLDVTGSKKAEDVLRESEERLRLALDGARIGMWSTEIGSGVTDCTAQIREIFGIPPEAPLPRNDQWIDFVHPEDRERVLAGWMEGVAKAAPYNLEYRVVRPDGSVRWIDTRGQFQCDANGKPVRLIGITMDITERKRAERDLRESEAYFHGLADATPHLVWTARADGSVEYYNSRARQYDGIAKNPNGAWEWKPIIHEDDLKMTVEAWESAVRSGEIYECEHRLKLADGSYRWHLSRGVPLKNKGGEVVKWFGTATDIHDLRKSEQELRENDRRKDEFLAMLAHELRNPLAPIRNAVLAIQRIGSPEPHVQRMRDVIERQVGHLAQLVDDLLDVSRITRNMITLHKERLELSTVVGRAVEVSRSLIDARKHHLNVSLPADPVWIDGDMVRLAQIISNLLNNAAKYTDVGGSIRLTAETTDGEVVLKVKDDGMGIPSRVLPYIFDLFTQGERAPDRSQGGLGIGLTLVRRLVELHGGHVEANSEGPGKGSEFVVRLPLAEEAESNRETPATENATGFSPARRRRILVVDDNVDAAETMAMLLEFSGHEVKRAYDGLEAVEAARAFRPHVVLLDIGLPGIDGYEVARRLRHLDETKEAFLVAVTGYGKTEDRIKALTNGFNYHITKPVDPAELNIIIKTQKLNRSDESNDDGPVGGPSK